MSRLPIVPLLVSLGLSAGLRVEAQKPTTASLTVHGYLTQGYGISGRDTVMGLTPQGTTDYRRAAIVARYATSASNMFVAQVGHRRLGSSPTMAFENDLKLDMAFFEHRFASGTSIRVGKPALPFGIFNETRYVGTLLPFYRAPFSVYSEGAYVSEAIDGLVVSHRFRLGERWEVAGDVYGGNFSLLEFEATPTDPTQPPEYRGARMQSRNVLGGQLWLSTPIEGLRLGAGGQRREDYGGLFDDWRALSRNVSDWTASLDGNFERWQLRAELSHIGGRNFNYHAEYVQAGVSPLPWLSVNLQTELIEGNAAQPPAPMMRILVNRDDAIGVNFNLRPSTVVKFEQHRTSGFNFEQVVNVFGPRILGSYFIASLSTTF